MSEIVKLYNPANAASLNDQQLSDLRNLTTEQLRDLAKAYPNGTFNRGYLMIVDGSKPIQNQLPALSTFQNLYNLRTKNGLSKYIAIGFKGNYQKTGVVTPKKGKVEVLDLSDTELLTLPGFKTGVGTNREESFPEETVKVTKVEKQIIQPEKKEEVTPAKEEKPKRTRRTKAQIEAANKKNK